MNTLFVLHDIPTTSVPLLADIHLRPTLLTAYKVLSAAIQRVAQKEIVIEKNMDGVKEFKYHGFSLLPPYPQDNPWVSWVAKNYSHFWWLVETAWYADKELTYRFNVPQSSSYLKITKWVEEGAARHFPKFDSKIVSGWPASFNIAGDEIKARREHYKILQQKIRMKWTNRSKPEFMLIGTEATLCPQCGGPKPKSGICDINCHYGNN